MRRRGILGLLVSCALALAVSRPRVAGADDFVVIVNAKNATSSLSTAEVRKLFTGQTKQWSSSVVQAVVGEDGTPELGWLARAIFGASPKELLTRIKLEVFRGEMKRPIVAGSSDECVAAVAKNEGAIGVVTATAAKSLPATVAVVRLSE
jgi:ABC-type phosphate transport system substrate-binding protein